MLRVNVAFEKFRRFDGIFIRNFKRKMLIYLRNYEQWFPFQLD